MFNTIAIKEHSKEWHTFRQNGIGGSEASAVLGKNPYKTNVELWEEKALGKAPKEISNINEVSYGLKAEKYLTELFALDYPEYKLVNRKNQYLVSKEYPFLFASLDSEIVNSMEKCGVLEVKTTNILKSMHMEKWNYRIPDNYYIQVLHQLLVTGYEYAILKAQLKTNYDGDLRLITKHYFIIADQVKEDLNYLLNAEVQFWESVKTKKKPGLILPEI